MAEPSPYPDLLHPEAACRIDEERTRLALGLAFTSGVSGGLFAEALADVRLAPSPFHPDGFEDDLFVPTFVANAFSITVDGKPLKNIPDPNDKTKTLANSSRIPIAKSTSNNPKVGAPASPSPRGGPGHHQTTCSCSYPRKSPFYR